MLACSYILIKLIIAVDVYCIVEDICPQVLFTSKNCEISIRMLLVRQLRLLTTLNVSGCIIVDQGADMMAAVFLETISLQNLDLSNTRLNSINATKINNSLKRLSSLKYFSISNNDIDDRASDSTITVILSNSLIQKISLSHNKIHYPGILNIVNALSQQIKVLDISNNFIAAYDITDLVTAISKFSVLQELNLSQNLLNLNNVLTIAKTFRNHPTLQSLDLSDNTISFTSACEFIVGVILSVNQTLTSLNVCGRNIRPRYIEDYLSSPSSTCTSNSSRFTFQNLYLLQRSSSHATNIQTKFIKVEETCSISSKDIISYYVDHFGGAFYNQYHNFAIVIPPGAVTQGECVEIQATANYFGPYIIPDGLYAISSCFWISANYEFKVPVYIIMSHYAKIRNLKDISKLHILQKCTYHPNDMNEDLMNITPDGVYFDTENGYCVLATEHFCTYCGAKSDKDMPEHLTACYYTFDEPSSGLLIAEVCFYPTTYDCRKVTYIATNLL